MRLAPLAALLLLAACTPFAPVPDAPDEDEPATPPPTVVVAPAPEAKDTSLPPGFEALGQPCPESAEQPLRVVLQCNDGRVASAYKMVHHHFGGPGAEEKLPPMPKGSVEVQGNFGKAHVYIDGDRLWIASTCVHCRVPSEELRIVALPLAADHDIAALQTNLALPREPVLRTGAAWREALARRRASG